MEKLFELLKRAGDFLGKYKYYILILGAAIVGGAYVVTFF